MHLTTSAPRAAARGLLLTTIALAAATSCRRPAEPRGGGSGVLFIGNSHTANHDVPGLFQALADAAGVHVAVASEVVAGTALIDHWNDGEARRVIRAGGWAYVVLQQGWTPAGVCRDTLRLATRYLAAEARRVGARTALFQTWPPADLPQAFPGTIESYAVAARDVGGVLVPVAEAWLAAWQRDPTIALYDDGLHASPAGSYLAALVLYARLVGRSPLGLPSRVVTASGLVVDIDPAVARTLQEAADAVTTGATALPTAAAPVETGGAGITC